MSKLNIKCYGDGTQPVDGFLDCRVRYSLKHVKGDPDSVFRFYLESDSFSLEVTPTKGLSVRDFSYNGRQFFWKSPLENLPDPKKVFIEGSMLLNGKPEKGTRWIEYFASHIEMLGLDNWGIPREKGGRILGLHGNVSSIPVEEIRVEEKKGIIAVSGFFNVYDPNNIYPKDFSELPYFKVEKRIVLDLEKPALLVRDRITNIRRERRFPDWGYHVQLRPEAGCRYLIPSGEVKKRGGGIPEEGFDFWREAAVPVEREERGFIHKGLEVTENAFPDGSPGVETLLRYKDGSGIKCVIPLSPYTLSWFSCGGKNGSEFIIPGKAGEPDRKLLHRNWDGVGPEIGASALDHDGDTDPSMVQDFLEPGESVELQIYLELLEREAAGKILKKIESFGI